MKTPTAAMRTPGRPAASADKRTLRISVGPRADGADVALQTSLTSCWRAMLGPFELPDDATLDVLASAFEKLPQPPGAVELIGPPGACLLPLVWLRSIWLDESATVTIRWPKIAPPDPEPAEQLAARLACALADRVECDDEARASDLWGITPGEPAPLGAEAYDLLLGLVDSWDLRTRNGPVIDPSEWQIRTRSAMRECAEAGLTRVALYGAGTHTRALGPLLQQPPVDVLCIIDDDSNRHGQKLWGFPIVSRERAVELGAQAVILSANLHEPKLWANRGVFEKAGVRVVRLYTEG